MAEASGEKRDTVVLGASAGGIEALLRVLPAFAQQSEASIFVVQHLPADGQSVLHEVLARALPLPVRFAVDGEAILPRHVYVAPPDRHLLIVDDRVRLIHGARENRARPAIDPLFRSAAVTRRGRVAAALLSGLLDDGVAGLMAVKRCGGLVYAQAPDDAAEPEMPRRAVEALGDMIDGVLPAEKLGTLLAAQLGTPAPPAEVPEDLRLELRMLLGEVNGLDVLSQSPPSAMTCPECGGPLWALSDGRLHRYRCHTGHVYGSSSLLSAQERQIELALWAAIKGMEERSQMLSNLARDDKLRARTLTFSNTRFEDEAQRLRQHAQTLRDLLVASMHAG